METNLVIILKFGNVAKNWKCGKKFGNFGGGIGNVEKIWGKLGNLKNIRKFFGEKIGYLGEKNWKFGEKKLEIILKFEKKIGNLEKILEN